MKPDWKFLGYKAMLYTMSLEERRNRADLIEVYNMMHGLISTSHSLFPGRSFVVLEDIHVSGSRLNVEPTQDYTSFLIEY